MLDAALLLPLYYVADATITVRQNSQYHAVDPPEALQEPTPQQPAKIAVRPQPSPTEGNSAAPDASVPPGSHPTGQSGAEPANQAPDASSPALLGTARAAMLIASNDPQHPVVSVGSTVWSTIPPVPGRPPGALRRSR